MELSESGCNGGDNNAAVILSWLRFMLSAEGIYYVLYAMMVLNAVGFKWF